MHGVKLKANNNIIKIDNNNNNNYYYNNNFIMIYLKSFANYSLALHPSSVAIQCGACKHKD